MRNCVASTRFTNRRWNGTHFHMILKHFNVCPLVEMLQHLDMESNDGARKWKILEPKDKAPLQNALKKKKSVITL